MGAGFEANSRIVGSRLHAGRDGGHAPKGFSLIELVIVIVILAIIAAIAIPRLSRGTDGATEAATAQNVAVLQKAVDLYAAEHGIYPDPDQVSDQLTLYTDGQGAVSKSKVPPFTFGPYLRKLPPLTTGPNKGKSEIGPKDKDGVAWVYDGTSGVVAANTGNATSTTQPSASPPTTNPAD